MRLVIGVTGASGVEMSYHLLKALKEMKDVETHLIVSDSTVITWEKECSIPFEELSKQADVVYDVHNMAASVSSGTFHTDGMIIIPCSMKTLGGLASGYAENLILRAADVSLKEHRKLVIVPRETPFSALHLRNLKELADMGVVVLPPVLSFYNQPQSLEDQIKHVIGKVLSQFGLDYEGFRRWS